MTTTHTPGDWNAEYCGRDTIKVIKTSDNRRIATVKVTKTYEMDEANARLMAAAPELLDALIMFVDQYANGIDGNDSERESRPEVIAARAAIKKARGE